MKFILLFILLSFRFFCFNLKIDRRTGIDIIFKEDVTIKSADVFVEKKIYFLILIENGRSILKALNYSQEGNNLVDVLHFPVRSAQSVVVDWLNGNLYWADKANRFFEVVDLNHGLVFPLPRQRRLILFSNEIADIDSMVIDPFETYIFWLQIGADMVIERARLNGQDRVVIHRSIHYKSSCLAIDRHTKMLFWLGIDGVIHRIDYQGRTGCNMRLQGDWKNWKPTFFVFSESRLTFINNGAMWSTVFNCGAGSAIPVYLIKSPEAIVSVGYQLARPGDSKSQCRKNVCKSICLPANEIQYDCTCSTGINPTPSDIDCPEVSSKSLLIGSSSRIYELSLQTTTVHMEPIFEEAGIPFRLAYDSLTSSIFYVDYNSSSIHVLSMFGNQPSRPLVFDSPVLFQAPSTIAIDTPSRNMYWMNYQTCEVWVARLSASYQLKNTVLLLSWKTNVLSGQKNNVPLYGRQACPGELAVDSERRYLFVSATRDGLPSIERYWLDGTNRFVILKSSYIISPRGLALDTDKQELFFVDTSKDEMICVGYSGSNFRVIGKSFDDFFGLTFLDGYIYWTDLETLMVNKIRSDGAHRSSLVSTHNLRAVTMPIVAIPSKYNSTKESPCGITSNVCDQLCFPSRSGSLGYSCACTNQAHVLLNMSRCSRQGRIALLYNSTYIVLQDILSKSEKKIETLFKITLDDKITSVQIDRFRNFIYWINTKSNCIERTVVDNNPNSKSKIFCLTSDKITSISIDATRNNLYVSIKSIIWSRIEIIRLPFNNADIMYRRVIINSPKTVPFMGSVISHSSTKKIFWLTGEVKYGIIRLYQADLDGEHQIFLWRGVADIYDLVSDDNGEYLYWKSVYSRTIYRYDIMNKIVKDYQVSEDILKKTMFHLYGSEQDLYMSLNSSLFYIHLPSGNTITLVNLKPFLNTFVPILLHGFMILPQNITTKVALLKSDIHLGDVVMCPTEISNTFLFCTQFCLPSLASRCSCGSPYVLERDGFTCKESINHLLVLTSTGEVIGIGLTSHQGRKGELDATEWIEIPEHRLIAGQRFIDALYWTRKNIVLLLDNNGQLIGKHRSWPYYRSKVYKHLSIIKEENDILTTSSTYEKAFRHFLEKDATHKDQYASNRFSITFDPITDTLIWSDWVKGVIVTEKLNNHNDTIDYCGIVVDFRHSSRRPLKVAIAPISSSLFWISADLSITTSNDSSIWRQFWIEMSDMDGSRRTVLVRDPGIPTCLTVDDNTGRVYWIDKRSNVLMYLRVHWDNYQIKAGHVLGRLLKVSVSSLLTTGVGQSSSAMTVLKKHLLWADWFQQILASAALDLSNSNMNNNRMATEKIQVFELNYVKNKLNNVAKLLPRLGNEDFRSSSVGTVLKNHPCSYEMIDVNGALCSHLCLSTIPISLAEDYTMWMTAQQLGGKYRCACPYDMAIKSPNKQGKCLKSIFFQCQKNEILCRAGKFFIGSDKLISENCLSQIKQCDFFEDCLDGSDEVGCSHCNSTHSYACSASGKCIDIRKRCDGISDCDSDEKCCDNQKFECLTGHGPSRCIALADKCNGFRDCADGSDELGCQLPGNVNKDSSNNDITVIKNIRDNHLVAIITGFVALLACIIAVLYICVSRRNRNKTVHESCMFRANNVNIMLISHNDRAPRHSRHHRSEGTMFHAKSCDVVDIYKSNHESEQLTHSLTSLSDIYQRIRDPNPDKFSALKVPLFTIQDDVLFNVNRFRRVQDPYTSSDSNEKFENPPPSEVTVNSNESINFAGEAIEDGANITERCSEIITPCESELDEIYFHRYRSYGDRSPTFQNYPSRLLQMLLTSNHSNYLHQNNHSSLVHSRRRVSQPNYNQQRRKKLFRYQKRKKNYNLSLSPRRKLYCSQESLATRNISPPPPSPITVTPHS